MRVCVTFSGVGVTKKVANDFYPVDDSKLASFRTPSNNLGDNLGICTSTSSAGSREGRHKIIRSMQVSAWLFMHRYARLLQP